ncbi:MAG: valine--tRNA ligase [Sedimentisphaerales bacterium]|nr:valine--tRNA ligase [Sedimentisphaerales bacterium]
MSEQLSKVYEPKVIERQANELWSSNNFFHADSSDNAKDRKAYTIVIPPPNVTAPLHLGHALNNTLQDVLIRFRRMQNYNTLWMPGTDHAGIATQTVVEKRILSEEGKRRTDFERQEFVSRVQAWKDEYEACIISQLKAMGCSCDWQRTRFTMDEVCAKAVRAAFFRFFKDGLIYRGKRLVNWDPATQTVLADDEVEHELIKGHFWYLRYPLVEPVDASGRRIEYVTVATTRPETMLGDTAVAMNPSDKRAEFLVGKKVKLPIVGRIIPIIADEHVVLPDPDSDDEKARFSTGFLKVTPAHDPDDWEIGQRHGLGIINVMAPDGSISDKYGWEDVSEPEAQSLLGMDRFEAREAIVEWFRTEKLLEDVREYSHEVGHSYRSHVPIEPYLSDQWYIAVKKPVEHLKGKFGEGLIEGTDVPVNSLAGLALKPLLDGRLRFIPERYAKTYQAWLENLRDWPISRQLWWGHRIPVWTIKFSTARYRSIGDSDNKHDVECETHVREFLKLCGIDINNEVAFFRSDRLIEGTYPFYVCGKTEKIDEILELLSKILGHKYGPRPKEQLKRDVADHDEFKERYGNNAFRYIMDNLHQRIKICALDIDVLDTWFSSALWPFSTMGWPDETPELKTFYPGDVLCTAREIITLWVSRMVMMGQYYCGDIPFRDVYIHAMIQDGQGRKMSKSLGNGIDPLVAIDSHGADAMRFTLASMTTDTQDIRMPVEPMTLPDGRQVNTSPKFDIGRNFCNKLWNASRFALMNLEGINPGRFDAKQMDITDRWILSRLAKTISEVTESLNNFKYSEPLSGLYRFFWNDLCDWYLEWAKPRMQDKKKKQIAQNVLAFVLDQTLRLLHPFIPFITEGIFQKLNEIAPARGLRAIAELNVSKSLSVAQWPKALDSLTDESAEKQIDLIQAAVRTIRDIKSNRNIPPGQKPVVSAKAQQQTVGILNTNVDLILNLAGVKEFKAGTDIAKPDNAAIAIMEDATEVYVHDAVDIQAEREKLQKQKQQVEIAKKAVEAKLANENFVSKARPEVVERARERLAELSEQLKTVEKHLSDLDNT